MEEQQQLENGRRNINSISHASASAPPYSGDAETAHISTAYRRIGDNYRTLGQVTQALTESGLESSNLILGIDFTKSNQWTGTYSFNGRCLHHLSEALNPYQHAISIIGKTLSFFDEDDLIPCFGFGDVTTHDRDVFTFYHDHRPCNGFEEALSRYREIVPHVRFAGPTSFAPIIETAIEIVDQSGGQFHVLFIIADGQVTRSMHAGSGRLSPQEKNTIDAIVRASAYPLSIIVVGVGDGPWDAMHEFDDNIPARAFDNIQFVNFTEIMSRNISPPQKEYEFALAALMEIPLQFTATLELHLLGNQRGHRRTLPLPPPSRNLRTNSDPFVSPARSFSQNSSTSNRTNCSPSVSRSGCFSQTFSTSNPSSPVSTSSSSNRCPVCITNKRNLALGCGHQTCRGCGDELSCCPICWMEIVTRIRLFD